MLCIIQVLLPRISGTRRKAAARLRQITEIVAAKAGLDYFIYHLKIYIPPFWVVFKLDCGREQWGKESSNENTIKEDRYNSVHAHCNLQS